MENIQRYSCGNGEGMFNEKEGYWVTYEDYKNLLDKYNELKQVKNNGVLDDVIGSECKHLKKYWTIDPYDQKCFKCSDCGHYL